MSASTSCKRRAQEALRALRGGGMPPDAEMRALGEDCPVEFFRIVVEALSDSFDVAQVDAYERLMRVWIPPAAGTAAEIPDRVDTVYVLSRVTLGADIKITSMILDAMKTRFPPSRIVLVGGRKPAELFAADQRVEHLEMEYPRTGSVSERLAFAAALRLRLAGEHRIVVDPDSRMTQLGLAPACEPERFFHFPSRRAGAASWDNLSVLTSVWLREMFGVDGEAYMAPRQVLTEVERPYAAVSLGVGGNDEKRVPGEFESWLVGALCERFGTVWVDRGAGGEEAMRVTSAVSAAGAEGRVRYWEESFAGFASIIGRSSLYAGYDSAGQHAAAAAGIPLVTIFAGAANDRFRARWSPWGPGRISVVNADGISPEAAFERVSAVVGSGHVSGQHRKDPCRPGD